MNEELKDAIIRFTLAMGNQHAKQWPELKGHTYYADEPGVNVVRIISAWPGQRSAHSFVVIKDHTRNGKDWKVGDILKTATWKAPTFNFARGNVLTNDYSRVNQYGAL